MGKWLSFAIGALVVGGVAYNLYYVNAPLYGTLHPNDKLLGLVDEPSGFGVDDVVKGMVIVGVTALAINVAHGAGIPASTSLPV